MGARGGGWGGGRSARVHGNEVDWIVDVVCVGERVSVPVIAAVVMVVVI